jgi:voltage-gated potassium channel
MRFFSGRMLPGVGTVPVLSEGVGLDGVMGAAGFAGRAWLLASAVAALLGCGVAGYLMFGFTLVDAVYLTVSTLTTEGFATPVPLSNGAKIFTVSLSLLGVTVFVAVLGVLATALVDGQLTQSSRRRSMQRRITDLRNHHIICAYGRVGRAAAREFQADGVPFVVIEVRPEMEEDLRRDGVLYLIGNSSSEGPLCAAGIHRARGLVCAVDSDAENVYITLVARSLNPDISIVARASEDAAADRLYRAGAYRVVSPYATSGRRMALIALRPEVVDFLDLARSGAAALRIEELLIAENSELVGQTLDQLCGSATALLIRRAGGELLPNPSRDAVVEPGDVVVMFGEPDALRALE